MFDSFVLPLQIFVFMKKLILAGVIVFVDPGSITQVSLYPSGAVPTALEEVFCDQVVVARY